MILGMERRRLSTKTLFGQSCICEAKANGPAETCIMIPLLQGQNTFEKLAHRRLGDRRRTSTPFYIPRVSLAELVQVSQLGRAAVESSRQVALPAMVHQGEKEEEKKGVARRRRNVFLAGGC